MRCLSVRQPWAHLLVTGVKDVENRTWGTGYKGALLVHAGLKIEHDDCEYLEADGHIIPQKLSVGAVVGVVDLVCCKMAHTSKWHNHGCWGWYVANAKRFIEPIKYKGKLGLFDMPISLADVLARETYDGRAGE